MRAAQIVYEFPSISETFVLAQMRGMLGRGFDVRIFADSKGSNAELPESARDLLSRATYFGLPFKRAREAVGHFKSRTSGGDSALIPHAQPQTTSMRLRFEARAFAREGRFDVIHAHFGPNGVRAVRLRAKRVLSGPIITSFYGYDVTRHWSRGGYGELFSHGDCFIALSETMREQLVKLGAPRERVVVHRLGVDVDTFARPKSSGEALELISVARLVEKKGIQFAIRAIATLVRRDLRVRYTIVGDGPLRDRLEKLAAELGVTRQVEFAGARSHDDVAQLLSRSDVLLAPSVTAVDGDSEGTPVAIFEAGASGIPVISTFHSGIGEVVQNGVTGFLVPERDEQALADRIAQLAVDASLRTRMGNAGRKFVEANHNLEKLNDDLAKLYLQVAGHVNSV